MEKIKVIIPFEEKITLSDRVNIKNIFSKKWNYKNKNNKKWKTLHNWKGIIFPKIVNNSWIYSNSNIDLWS